MESGKTNDGSFDVVPSLWQCVATGAIGFGLVSLAVFATVAFAEGWMYNNLGLWGAYLAWTVLFIFLGASALHSLVRGIYRGWRFFGLFGLAFFAYSVGWVTAYFLQRNAIGEWMGSLAGSILMALVFALGFRAMPSLIQLIAVLFITNSAGYFIGSTVNNALGKQIGMMSWGGIYGLFLGAGLGTVLFLMQRRGERRGSAEV